MAWGENVHLEIRARRGCPPRQSHARARAPRECSGWTAARGNTKSAREPRQALHLRRSEVSPDCRGSLRRRLARLQHRPFLRAADGAPAGIGCPGSFWIRGNHDAESIITRQLSLPENTHQFSTRKAESMALDELNVTIHGRSYGRKAVTDNLAVGYPDPVAGHLNVGVLHTSADGREGHGELRSLQCRGVGGQGLRLLGARPRARPRGSCTRTRGSSSLATCRGATCVKPARGVASSSPLRTTRSVPRSSGRSTYFGGERAQWT